jgi:AhpC/TSA family
MLTCQTIADGFIRDRGAGSYNSSVVHRRLLWPQGAARGTRAVLLAGFMWLTAHPAAQSLDVLTVDGGRIDPFQTAGSVRATVFVFTRTDCPIANRYAPTLKQLRREFEPRGVRFWLVFVDPAESPDVIRSYLTAYNHHADAVRDPRHTLVAFSGATVTPEAAIYVANGQRPRLMYRGRIDDRYVDFGRSRPKPSKHDLREALEAVLAGRNVAPATTPAVGCIIADLR